MKNKIQAENNVFVIPATKPSLWSEGNLRTRMNIKVGAYCRVSTDNEEQHSSYTKQKQYYESLIQNREGWHFAGIYADEAITGTSRIKRTEFNRMIDDAVNGKLDYIVTKSISRFARNTVDTLECVRRLRLLTPPVGVYFEKENIDTLDTVGELFLTILSAMAQDESRSIGDNVRWSIQKNFSQGKPTINLNRMLGYDMGKNGEWLINEKQAETVRIIFKKYICGLSAYRIAKSLNEKKLLTVNNKKWNSGQVLDIIKNEKYVGDLEMQKNITVDMLSHKVKKNTGEAPRYYIKNHHAPVIDRATWELAQEIYNNKLFSDKQIGSPFKNIRCICSPDNGNNFMRSHYNSKKYGHYPVWKCKYSAKSSEKKCTNCSNKLIYEYALKHSFMEMLYNIKNDLSQHGENADIINEFNKLQKNEIHEKHFEYFLECINSLPDLSAKNSEPFFPELDEDIYHQFIVYTMICGDRAEYYTSFGVKLVSCGNLRSIKSYLST